MHKSVQWCNAQHYPMGDWEANLTKEKIHPLPSTSAKHTFANTSTIGCHMSGGLDRRAGLTEGRWDEWGRRRADLAVLTVELIDLLFELLRHLL